MPWIHLPSRPIVFLAAAAFLPGCASNAPSTSGSSTPPPTPTSPAESVPTTALAAAAPLREDGWYAAPVGEGSPSEFWWRTCTDKDETRYTLIAAPLDVLPSSAQDGGGIRPPARSEQSAPPLMVEFCPARDGAPESNTLHNGFMFVLVEPRSARERDSTDRARWIPWPIIVRTPSHPGGAYAGVFITLAIQDPAGSFLRESVFRPNLGDNIPCERWNLPDGDDSKRYVHVTGGCCGDEYQFFLREVAVVNNIKGDVHQREVDSKSPEAVFLTDVCAFAQRAREIIAATPDPKPAPVTPCKSSSR